MVETAATEVPAVTEVPAATEVRVATADHLVAVSVAGSRPPFYLPASFMSGYSRDGTVLTVFLLCSDGGQQGGGGGYGGGYGGGQDSGCMSLCLPSFPDVRMLT